MALHHDRSTGSEAAVSPRRRRHPLRRLLLTLITGGALVGAGFLWGYRVRDERKLTADELRQQEQEQLRTMGWTTSAEGVLTRWCSEDCNPPRL